MSETDHSRTQLKEEFNQAKRFWLKSQVLHRSPSWNGEPKSVAKLEALVKHPECAELLFSSVNDDNQLISSYCLYGLELLQSNLLEQLPEELLNRKDKVTVLEGSFSTSMDLGGFARQCRNRVAEKRSK